MPNIRITTKNEYFTYFEVDGLEGKFRMSKQIWNAEGISIMIQGPSWDGNGINGFGMRHLLATNGGKHAGSPEAKAASILNKRQNGVGINSRTIKQKKMIQALVPKRDLRDKAARDRDHSDRRKAKAGFDRGYATNAYGPSTNICTFVILDDLTQEEVAKYFAKSILFSDIAEGATKSVTIRFDNPIVINAQNESSITYYYAIKAQVKKHQGIYHVFHCDGAAEPALDPT